MPNLLNYHNYSYSSPSRARTYNNSVNSRVLYHWAIEDYQLKVYTFKTSYRFNRFFNQALDLLVTVSSMCCHTSTSDLSTSSSSRGLTTYVGISHLEGGFTLRCLQRLSLPDLATLPCRWSTTDTPVVRPSRSSRTKDSSSQISSARAG